MEHLFATATIGRMQLKNRFVMAPLTRQRADVMGVPLPNAWLGNVKNVDLVAQYGESEGFWQALANGIDALKIEDEKLRIRLKE